MKPEHDSHSIHSTRKQLTHESSSLALNSQRSSSKLGSHISDLYGRFMTLNNQVSIDHDLSSFNIAEFQKEGSKMRYDQQMVQVKLKRLENSFELKKANLQLENRNKRSHKKKHINAMSQQDSYLNVYKQYSTTVPIKLLKGEIESDSDQQGKKNEAQPIKGVGYYNELKKHPKLLKFAVEKIKQKEVTEMELKSERTEALQKIKNQIKKIAQKRSLSRKGLSSTINPEQLADNLFRKLYSKKNKQPPIQEAKTDRRVADIIDKQDSIMSSIDERSLSNENYKKLKGRMKQIASVLYLHDKKHAPKIFLPRIRPNNHSTIQYQQYQ